MTASTRRELRSAATSTSTTAIGLIRALTDARPIKPTSTRCLSARRPNPGRGSTYRRGNSVQTTAATSLAAALQHDQAARIARIQAASTGGICPCLRRVAGCATPTGSTGHAGATASLKLTFHLAHSVGANQRDAVVRHVFHEFPRGGKRLANYWLFLP